MKKLSILFFILATVLSVQSFAIPKGPCDKKETCCDEASPGPFSFSYPKDIGLSCPRDFYTYGEFLYMKAIEDGLDYAITDDQIAPALPIVGEIIGFSSRSKEWDWRPGFRVGFGAYLGHDNWSMNATWTYIRIKADSEENVAPGTIIVPIFIPRFFAPFIQTASARWSGDFNTFDISFGKPYHVSRYFISHPSFGIRAAWIDQDFHVRLFDGLNKIETLFKNDYWGIGFRAMYQPELVLGSNWQIFAKAAFAILFSKYDTNAHAEPLTTAYSIKDSFYGVAPNAEFGIGICWKKFFHKDQYRLSVKASYEHQHWWEQNQMLSPHMAIIPANTVVIPVSKGDLSFNGFSFGLHLEF